MWQSYKKNVVLISFRSFCSLDNDEALRCRKSIVKLLNKRKENPSYGRAFETVAEKKEVYTIRARKLKRKVLQVN